MKTKQKKLQEAYEYARSIGSVHTQAEFAKKIKFGRANLSSAFNGNTSYLTDGLFKKICDTYDTLSIDYFLKDEGAMLKTANTIGNIANSTVIGANVSGNGNTFHHNDGKEEVMKEKKERTENIFETFMKETHEFHEYTKRQDDHLKDIIRHSYMRNERNMERMDKLIEQQNVLIKEANADKQEMRKVMDRILNMLEKLQPK